MTNIVTAPLVIVRNPEQGGRQEYLYQGSPLPSYVDKGEVKRLVEDGSVTADAVVVVPLTVAVEVDPATGVASDRMPVVQPDAPSQPRRSK